jgi:hypothetical protein
MKRLLGVLTAVALSMAPFLVYAQSDQTTAHAPAIEQTLVPEGDFAMKLVASLKMGTVETEAQAEDMLSSVGRAPRNGWIADYPVTPDIIGELQKAVMAAADSNKLPMGRDEALKVFQNLTAEFGLAVAPETSSKYSENQAPTSPEYVQPTVINNYYYDEGPPVVTYYPPPWDYDYLYAWVPYPFWCSGFFFPGFFILHDFHRTVVFGHRTVVVTNHLFDHRARRVVVIDPVRRMRGRRTWVTSGFSPNRKFNPETRRGAASIFERSRERVRLGNAMPRTTRGGFTGNIARPGSQNRSKERSLRNRGNIERRNEMNIQGPRGEYGRSFSAPNATYERSVNQPPMKNRGFNRRPERSERSFSSPSISNRSSRSPESFGRSFSASSRSFSAPRGSFGGFHGGDLSGGFHGGGFGGFHGGGFSHGGRR